MFARNKTSLSHIVWILLINIFVSAVAGPRRRPKHDSNILLTTLINVHSKKSPYYNPTMTIKQIADYDLNTSISRGLHLTSNISIGSRLDAEIPLTADWSRFLVPLLVGSEKVKQYLSLDSGSNLLWINCKPCGKDALEPIYDPLKSTTYRVEDCDLGHTCWSSGPVKINCQDSDYKVKGCKFSVRYGSAFSKGNLGQETFRFGKKQDEVVPNLAFGCAHNSSVKDLNGIFGLGNIPISFLSQYEASKFSYCFGDLRDPDYPYNMLAIGENVKMWGARTPLTVEDKNYVNLVDIAIGDIWLKTSRQYLFRRDTRKREGGMLVDSGTTLTFLPQIVLTEFEQITRSTIKKLNLPLSPFFKIYRGYRMQCYIGDAIHLKPFPKVKLHFQNRAYMELTPDNVFVEADDNLFCLAILPSSLLRRDTTILGNVMQQNFNIAFDLKGKELAFQRTSCKSVEDYYGHDEL